MVNWTEETIESAIDAVNCGMSVRKAALTYGIPKSTLQAHINNDYIGSVGKPKILKWEEELLLVTLITFMSDIGFSLCKLQILENLISQLTL